MKRKIPLLSLLVRGGVLALFLLSYAITFATDIIPLKSDEQGTENGKERPRMPARPVIGYYSEGVFSVPEWPWLDEAARLTVVTADGTTAVDLECSGADIAAGIHIGRFDSFTVTLATASGVTLSGNTGDNIASN